MRIFFIFKLVLLINILPAIAQHPGSELEQGFRNPPVDARPKALWPWVNGNFSLSQITFELEQASQKGMGGFDIWDVGTNMNPGNIVPDGPAFLSDESVNAIGHTMKEAERLGLEIGLITSSSWNAGGAWVKPEHGAMGLFRTDTVVTGPSVFRGVIPYPEYPDVLKGKELPWYSEVALLAVPDVPDSTIISPSMIIDLKGAVGKKGMTYWKVPAGRWRITRYVCMPTGQQLAVPSEASKGLMLDHFSAEAQKANMEYVIDRLRTVLGDRENRSLKYLYEDSYEVNSAVWTPLLPEQFEKRYRYSMVPFLPVLDGLFVSDQNTTERFIFDYTKLLSDLIIENHYVLGRKMAEAEGLGFYAEAGGPGKPIHNVPFEDLKALGSLTVPRGEFWNKHPQLDLLQIVKGISSASHIYNQKYVEAEAFTSVWLWQEGPAELKPLADRAMCEGLNRFVYHTFPHSPPESGNPGWIYNFGTIINTTNGWWSKSEGFHNYLARCSYLLQQGNFVGDVAFYYGDKAPNFVSPKHIIPGLGYGYDYDVVNSDVILNRMSVKDGKIYLPHGQYYEVLVLPAGKKFNPEVLKKIVQLVSDGATIIGPRPWESYSLADTAAQNKGVRESAALLWGKCDSVHVQENHFGKGKVVWGKTVREVLLEKGVYPDVSVIEEDKITKIDYIHRISDGADIYFLRNKTPEPLSTVILFRVRNKAPEFWDPDTGEQFTVSAFASSEQGTEVPLWLGEYGSCFIIFRDTVKGDRTNHSMAGGEIAFTQKGEVILDPVPLKELSGSWEVRFRHLPGAPVSRSFSELTSWHLSKDSALWYFSGMASYRKSFILSEDILIPGKSYFLRLNHVKEIAEVYLNGQKLGLHWHPACQFNISPFLRAGENHIVIDVVNSINNMLVGDARKPEQFRITRSNISKLPNAWTTEFSKAPLIEAGLLGPVYIMQAEFPGNTAVKAEIKKVNGRFIMYRAGEPYFIKGAVGWGFLDELTGSGANSVRASYKFLDEAHTKGLTVLANLPMGAERNGFDYNDEQAVRDQYLKNKEIVEKYKDHPALLMWAIGNELDHIPGDKDYNLKVWDAINDIAAMIKEIDPNHPVMTVVGFGKLEKLHDIKKRCPDLDVLGINAYAALMHVPEWLHAHNWEKPFVVTEWGPSGWWEVPRTKHGVVVEETSTEKARVYQERYEKVILADPLCIGSYVFLWTTNRQERTHTWFNMFHDSLKTQTVEIMQYMWTGQWPANRTPRISSLSIDGLSALENIEVTPPGIKIATVEASDPDNDELTFEWELLPEPAQFGAYAGQGETKPEPVAGFIKSNANATIQFQVPSDGGINYRLFVYIRDGHGNIATANAPFYVQPE